MAQWLTNPTRNHEVAGFHPWPRFTGQGSSIAMSCGVGHRRGSDPVLLWLWSRLAATALIRPLAWEPPYASGVALEKAKRQKKIIYSCYTNISMEQNSILRTHGILDVPYK